MDHGARGFRILAILVYYLRDRDIVALWSRRRAGNRLIVSSNPTTARLWLRPRDVAWDAVPESMIEYIDPDFLFLEYFWY